MALSDGDSSVTQLTRPRATDEPTLDSQALCLPANRGAIKVVVLVQSIDVGPLQPVSSCSMGNTGVRISTLAQAVG